MPIKDSGPVNFLALLVIIKVIFIYRVGENIKILIVQILIVQMDLTVTHPRVVGSNYRGECSVSGRPDFWKKIFQSKETRRHKGILNMKAQTVVSEINWKLVEVTLRAEVSVLHDF